MRGLVIFLLMSLWLVGAGVAAAADATPPVIVHQPVNEAVSDTALAVNARVSDDVGLRRVMLYMRTAGTANYYAIPMRVESDEHVGVIPANFVTSGTLEYYIEAIDTSGNIATQPAAAASTNPYRVSVVRDNTLPAVTLRGPQGTVGDDNFLVVLVLSDEGNNIDPNSVRVSFNGQDVTSRARVSPRAITFLVQANEVKSLSSLDVRVADRAGNEVSQRFRIYQRPLVSGDFSLEFGQRSGASVFDAALTFATSWGPFSANGEIRNDDPAFTGEPGQPTNRLTLGYDSRILDVQVVDVATTLSPLTAQGYNHRGYNALLDLGIFESSLASGYSAQLVPGETYARRFLATRQALDLWLMKFGLNIATVIDQEELGIIVDPEQNYVLTLDATMNRWGIQAGAEVGASMLFPNARGDLWGSLDQLAASGAPFDELADTFDQVPEAVRKYMPLPHPNYWILDPPYLDLGAAVSVNVPVASSSLQGRFFRFGPDFRTVAGTATADREGYSASWTSGRLFGGAVRLNGAYENYRDNVYSLMSMIADAAEPTDAERNRFTTMQGGVNLRTPGRISIDLSGKRQETNGDRTLAALLAGQEKVQTDTVAVKVGNILGSLGAYDARFGGSVTVASSKDKVDSSNDKRTTTLKGTSTFANGPWTYGLGLTSKQEVDATGAAVNSPAVDLSAAWTQRNVAMLGRSMDRVRAEGRSSFGVSNGAAVDTQSSTHTVRVMIDPTATTRWTLQMQVRNSADQIANTTATETIALAGYVMRF